MRPDWEPLWNLRMRCRHDALKGRLRATSLLGFHQQSKIRAHGRAGREELTLPKLESYPTTPRRANLTLRRDKVS